MVLSFIDSGILIAAARGNSPRAQLALDILAIAIAFLAPAFLSK